MTPGEVKGYLKQTQKRKELTAEERKAISLVLDSVEIMQAVSSIISQANRKLKSVKTDFTSDSSHSVPGGQAQED